MSSIRVVIVDDQTLVRAGFRAILDAEPRVEVVGEASDGRQALDVVRDVRPDVVLMDIRMPVLDGVEATRRMVAEAPSTRVVMLTTFDLDEYVYGALKAGASGFLLKDVSREQLVTAVCDAAAGEAILAPAITRRLIERYVSLPQAGLARPTELESLSGRELDVLRLVAAGLSNAEIAGELYVSAATVKSHVASILLKLGIRDRVQAVVAAYESGLVVPGSSDSA